MVKHVEEDWSFFNTAVREKAESRPRPDSPTLRLVTPDSSLMQPPTRPEQEARKSPSDSSVPSGAGYGPSATKPSVKPEPETSKWPNPTVAAPNAGHQPSTQPPSVEPKLDPSKSPNAVPIPSGSGYKPWSLFRHGPKASKLPAPAIAPLTSGNRPPLSDDRMGRVILWLLFALVAVILLYAFASASHQNSDWLRPSVLSMEPNHVARGSLNDMDGVMTDYTTFNRVAFKDWSVVTGWKFARNGDASPSDQYCYLEVANPVGKQSYNIETRPAGVREQRPDALIPGLDDVGWQEATTKCQWHP